jgi:hypothetical protein
MPAALRVVVWLPVAVFGVLAATLAWHSRSWPLVHDAPILHYIATRIVAGDVPYRSVFDMNQPGAYLLHLAIVERFGTGDVAWRLFDLGWLGLTCAAAAVFAWPWGAPAGVGAAALFAVYHLSGGAWQAGQRDFLLCAFLLAAAAAAGAWLDDDRAAAWTPLGAGLALGAGMTLKPHAIAFALALGVVLAVAAWRRAALGRTLGAYAGGLAVVPVAVAAWLFASGGFGAWRDIVVDYLIPLYSRLTRREDWHFWRIEVWYALGAVVVLSLVTAIRAGRCGRRHAIAALGLAYGLVHFLGQRKGWEYHLYPLAAFAAVLAFSGVPAAFARRRAVAGAVLVAALLVAAVPLGLRGRDAVSAGWIRDKARTVDAVVADLGALLKPRDRVQMLDTTEGGTHALLRLGLPPATRYIYDFHFFHDVEHPVIQRMRAELVHDLAARPPRFVVVFTRGWPSGQLERLQRFPALDALLARDYQPVRRHPAYVILEARHRS